MLDHDIQTKYYNIYSNLKEQRYAYCYKTYLTSGSISALKAYLIDFYIIPNSSTRGVKAINIQKSIEQALAIAEANPTKRRRLNTDTIKQDKLEALQVHAIVSYNLSFRLVENLEFRAFIKYLNEDAELLLAQDYTQVRRQVIH